MAAPSEREPPQLPEEIVDDILLRSPPEQPAHLVRAAVVCKLWSRFIAAGGFRRRYRQRHRQPPVLGLVANLADTGGAARFVPTRCAFRPARGRADRPGYRAQDARHGRVLLSRMRAPPPPWKPKQEAAAAEEEEEQEQQESALAVWDPIAGEQRPLPLLPRPRHVRTWNAAVLCASAAAAAAGCDHLDCHGGPFRVVFVGIDAEEMFASVYSSESGAWSEEAATADLPPGNDHLDVASPGVLARGGIYFLLQGETRIVKCDPATREMSVVGLPTHRPNGQRFVLMAMEDGGLGCAQVDLNCMLRLWAMRIRRPDSSEKKGGDAVVWVITRAIDLKTTELFAAAAPQQLPSYAHALGFAASPPCVVVAVAEGAGVIFLKTNGGLYSFDLRSRQAVKVHMTSRFYDIIPYISFYTPVLRVAPTDA